MPFSPTTKIAEPVATYVVPIKPVVVVLVSIHKPAERTVVPVVVIVAVEKCAAVEPVPIQVSTKITAVGVGRSVLQGWSVALEVVLLT